LRKTLALAIAGVLTLALAAIAVASPQFTYTFSTVFTQKHPLKSTGFTTDIETSDPGEANSKPKGTATIVVTFPKGTKFNTAALPRCAATASNTAPITSGACASSQVGTGSSIVNAAPLAASVPGTITAYNIKNGIYFFVKTTIAGNVPLLGKLSGNKLTTDVASQIPSPGGLQSVITSFKLNIKAKKKGKKLYATTPKTCPAGGWVVKAHVTYTDGTAADYASKASPCSKK
jgi:hypothetical protein